ncbi:DUF2804 domain-containing protein [Metapseudomonas otitidis]
MDMLIGPDGQPRYGQFDTTPTLINYRDFDFRSPMGRRRGALAKWRRFHQFQYFGIISNELIGGCALANLSLLGVGFVYLFHPASGRMIERQFKLPLGWGTRFSQSPDSGTCELRVGRNLLRLENQAERREKRLRVELDDGTRIDALFAEQDFQPMGLCTPAGADGWVYARKVAGVPCQGRIESVLGQFDLGTLGAYAHHDWSAGYMRPETVWNWACLSGEAAGIRLGLNLSCGVNETSFTENCFWLDGELVKVDTVRFAFDRQQPLEPWHITSHDGQVDLRFRGEGLHKERLNAGFLASNFKQVFGRFDGVLRPHGRPAIPVEGLWGFVEDQYVKW